jgi:hypothetical protein
MKRMSGHRRNRMIKWIGFAVLAAAVLVGLLLYFASAGQGAPIEAE